MTGPVFASPMPQTAQQLHTKTKQQLNQYIALTQRTMESTAVDLAYLSGLIAALAIIEGLTP